MSVPEATANERFRTAAVSVARLTREGLDADQFYQRFLDAIPVPLGTLGSAAWLRQGNAFRSIAKGSRNPGQGVYLPYSTEQHAQLLALVHQQGGGKLFDPPAQTDYQVVAENSCPVLAIFLVAAFNDLAFLIEVFLPPDLSDSQRDEFVQQTDFLCDLASTYHQATSASASAPAPAGTNVGVAAAFGEEVHRSLSITETCFAIANEGRAVIGCDRVTVLTPSGKRYKVRSVSAQDNVNPRANLVQSLQDLVQRAMAVGEPFWYPADGQQTPPEIEQVLEAYLEAAMCRSLGIVPLFAAPPRQLDEELETTPTHKPAEPIGALVVERFSETGAGQSTIQARVNSVARQGGIALGNAQAHENIFLLPLWARIGAVQSYLFGSRRAKTLAALAAIAVCILLLAVVPAELKIGADGRLQPKLRRNVFAPLDGTVAELMVRHGDKLQIGDRLLTMRSDSIDLAIRELQGEIATTQTRMSAIRAQRMATRGSDDTPSTAWDDAAIEQADLERTLESLQTQLSIQQELQERLNVASPIDGQVLTWDVDELLRDRPLRRGQFLMEVAALDGPWGLDLDVQDRRIMHVLRAAEASGEALTVTYLLASDPRATYVGQIEEITRATNIDPEIGQYVRVRASVDAQQVPFLQPGTKIQAKIHCGQRPLGYVWFHEVWEFLQSRVFFKILP